MRLGICIAAALALAAPALARDLPVPAGKGWKHAETGLVLRTTLLGLPRVTLADSTASERDIYAQFNDADVRTSATIYLFHSAEHSVAIWFDRADYQARHRASYGGATPLAAAPVAFAPPGSTVEAALRQLYTPAHGPTRSTALAVIPLGDWLVAVRLSSSDLEPAALDARLTALIAEIGWPATIAARAAGRAEPVVACTRRMRFTRAKATRPDMGQALLGSLLAGAALSGKGTPGPDVARPWCRDGDGETSHAVFRKDGGSARGGWRETG